MNKVIKHSIPFQSLLCTHDWRSTICLVVEKYKTARLQPNVAIPKLVRKVAYMCNNTIGSL